jgi:hypothetical protein
MCTRTASTQTVPRAQKGEPSLDEVLQGAAKDAYTSAKILFNNGDFEGAAAKYGQAYHLSRDPRLLFNLAICEKNLHHYAHTQSLLLQYEHDVGPRITADDKATVDAALAVIKNLVGTVALTVTEAGATVSVDEQPAGATPLATPLVLDLGKHTLGVTKEGFATAEQTVVVSGGAQTAIAVALAADTHSAHLLVQAEPEAAITIDGRIAIRGRFDGKVASGVHAVLVTESGKLPYKTEIELKDGEMRSVNVTLDSEKHGTLWGWIVGGAAVAVAGAAVGGYFLFKTEPQPATPPDQLGSVQLAPLSRRR